MTTVTQVRERPILFSGEMVRAILAGRKTQTRRPARLNHFGRIERAGRQWHPDDPNATMACPYGRPGDRLWSRETWGWRGRIFLVGAYHEDLVIEYRADRARRYISRPISQRDRDGLPRHRAPRSGESEQEYSDYLHRFWSAWRPSIHMPRWASRITLEIMGVRVERVQEICEEDAIAEGVERTGGDRYWLGGAHPAKGTRKVHGLASLAFRDLWDATYASRGHGWDANPWVWVIEFRRPEPTA